MSGRNNSRWAQRCRLCLCGWQAIYPCLSIWKRPTKKPARYCASADSLVGSLRYLLRPAQHAQQVAAEDFQNILLTISTIEQFLRDIRITRHVFELLGHAIDAVEVGAESNVIDARYLDDVLDVIDDRMDAAGRNRMLLAPLHNGLAKLAFIGIFLLKLAGHLEHVARQPRCFRHDEAGIKINHHY